MDEMDDKGPMRPGEEVELVLDLNPEAGSVDVRHSRLIQIAEDRFLITQTMPLLVNTDIGGSADLTVVISQSDGPARFGFPVAIRGFTQLLGAGRTTEPIQAIELERTGKTQQYNVRMAFRLQPTLQSGLALYLNGGELYVFDVSVGGASFRRDSRMALREGELAQLAMEIDGKREAVNARLLRLWTTMDRMARKTGHVAVRFENMSAQASKRLAKKISEIEREARFRERHPD